MMIIDNFVGCHRTAIVVAATTAAAVAVADIIVFPFPFSFFFFLDSVITMLNF